MKWCVYIFLYLDYKKKLKCYTKKKKCENLNEERINIAKTIVIFCSYENIQLW